MDWSTSISSRLQSALRGFVGKIGAFLECLRQRLSLALGEAIYAVGWRSERERNATNYEDPALRVGR